MSKKSLALLFYSRQRTVRFDVYKIRREKSLKNQLQHVHHHAHYCGMLAGHCPSQGCWSSLQETTSHVILGL